MVHIPTALLVPAQKMKEGEALEYRRLVTQLSNIPASPNIDAAAARGDILTKLETVLTNSGMAVDEFRETAHGYLKAKREDAEKQDAARKSSYVHSPSNGF